MWRDSIGYDGGVNVYGYCNNNSVNLMDLYGTSPLVRFIIGLYSLRAIGLSRPADWASGDDIYHYVDSDNEFIANKQNARNTTAFYIKKLKENVSKYGLKSSNSAYLYFEVRKLDSESEFPWTIDGDGNGYTDPGWWLNGSNGGIGTFGSFKAKCQKKDQNCECDKVIIHDIDVSWIWRDRIDTRSYSDLRKEGVGRFYSFIEGVLVGVPEWVLNASFGIIIHSKDTRITIEVPCFELGITKCQD